MHSYSSADPPGPSSGPIRELCFLRSKKRLVQTLKSIVKKLPGIRGLVQQRQQLQQENQQLRQLLEKHQCPENGPQMPQFVPPGHYYSPIPFIPDIQRDEARIFGNVPRSLKGIDLHESTQMALIEDYRTFYAELPFAAQRTNSLRYFFENPSYSYSDAIFLYCTIRHLRPKRIIEVGSGYSSCVTLDTNELFFKGSIQTTFVEPSPELLLSLIKDSDRHAVRLISKRVQDTDLQIFEELESNDILFIDSTHVSKVDSDVNRIFFEILPRLAPRVHVHFHDIFYPFEYPSDWIYEGRAWTEAYLLRTFLEYNTRFRVVLMNTFLEHFHREWFEREMPLCLKNAGGSIWICREM